MSIILSMLLLAYFAKTTGPQGYDCPSRYVNQTFFSEHVTFTTFNCYWLFNSTSNSTSFEGIPWRDMEEAMLHQKKVGEIFEKIQSQIWSVHSVEDCKILDSLAPKGSVPLEIASSEDDPQRSGVIVQGPTRNNALFTTRRTETIPVVGIQSSCDFLKNSSSVSLQRHYITEFDFKPAGNPPTVRVLVFGVHFSELDGSVQKCHEREAQAKIVEKEVVARRTQYSKENPGYPYFVIISGTLNDFDLDIKGVGRRVPDSSTLSILKSKLGLFNVLQYLSYNNSYSTWDDTPNANGRELLLKDHILVSKEMIPAISDVGRVGLFKLGDYIYSKHFPMTMKIDIVTLQDIVRRRQSASRIFKLFMCIAIPVAFAFVFCVSIVLGTIAFVAVWRKRQWKKRKKYKAINNSSKSRSSLFWDSTSTASSSFTKSYFKVNSARVI